MKLIGRIEEKKTFEHCLNSAESKLIALYGRRRVGKTFLVRKYFGAKIRFEIAGLYNGEMSDQLTHFSSTLVKYNWLEASLHPPTSWKAAFDMLERFINSIKGKERLFRIHNSIDQLLHQLTIGITHRIIIYPFRF